MRSLPVLLIALALLPLSDAIKCKVKGAASGFPASSQRRFEENLASAPPVETCAPGIEYCAAFSGVGKGGAKLSVAACQDATAACAKEGCVANKKPFLLDDGTPITIVGHVCCCKGDMCTPPSSPTTDPTALLPLAALAAVLAARF